MAGLIPQSFINELLARVDLVEQIDRRIGLKKAGRNYTARCPFHDEKTPSFSVNPDKQFYYCFGCGASGNAISFLMEYEGQDFVSAVEALASEQGMEVPRDSSDVQQQPKYQALYALMQQCADYYCQQLKNHPQAKRAVAYLKQRGLSGQIAKTFALGYAPSGWQNLQPALGESDQIKADLVTTGMLIEKDAQRCYDRFRDRIMFPIRNRKGQVIGFGGRIIDKGEPKYLNSPETPLFHKGRELYGLYEMRKHLRNIEEILIVEGYMDVVALAQHDIRNAVATLGTATSEEHLNILFKICPKLVFCFDGDKAGRAAAMRALEHALPLLGGIREVRFMFLPEGEDPDSMVRQFGSEHFKQEIAKAQSLLDYLLDHLTQQVDMQATEGPARLVHLASTFLQKINDEITQTVFLQQLSARSGIAEDKLQQLLLGNQEDNTRVQRNYRQEPGRRQPKVSTQDNRPSPYRRAINLLLCFPQAVPAANASWLSQLGQNGADVLRELIDCAQQDEGATTESLLTHWQGRPEYPHLKKLAELPANVSESAAAQELADTLRQLEREFLEKQLSDLTAETRLTPPNQAQKAQLRQLLSRLQQLKHKI